MPAPDYHAILRAALHSSPAELPDLIAEAVRPLGGEEVTVYLVDFGHEWLQPVLAWTPLGGALAGEEEVATTMAGRVFTTGEPVMASRDGGVRLWVPVVEQASRTGVLALTVPEADADTVEHCRAIGVLTGLLIASAARYTDVLHLSRRARPMSLAADIQWDLLPPMAVRFGGGSVAGLLEPAYDVAGDGFDYAVNNGLLDLAVFDGMGHGIGSSLLTGLAVGAYRHCRREGWDVAAIHQGVEQAIAEQFRGESFVTGTLVQLDLTSGRLWHTSAGHPAPLLLRDHRVVGELGVDPTLPFGLGGWEPAVGVHTLQPGDGLLLYTDGVVEARTPSGELFGLDRLSDLVTRALSTDPPAEELARRVVRAVLEHKAGPLRDDATVVALSWPGIPRRAEASPVAEIVVPRLPADSSLPS